MPGVPVERDSITFDLATGDIINSNNAYVDFGAKTISNLVLILMWNTTFQE